MGVLKEEHGGSLSDAWKKSDIDGNGKVNMTEIESYFESLGFTESQFVTFLEDLEFDESDETNFEAFKAMFD